MPYSSDKTAYIGVFDSGVGGISVLRELVRQMPEENYVYFGDSANAPYGVRTPENIQELSEGIVSELLKYDIKCFVIACNTITSRALEYLNENHPEYHFFGIEPPLGPAVKAIGRKKFLVLATDATVKGKKLLDQAELYKDEAEEINLLGGPKFVTLVESGVTDSNVTEELTDYIDSLCSPYRDADAVLLGCTHFPFVQKTLQAYFGPDTVLFDGAAITTANTKEYLEAEGLRNDSNAMGTVILLNSDKDSLPLEEELLKV